MAAPCQLVSLDGSTLAHTPAQAHPVSEGHQQEERNILFLMEMPAPAPCLELVLGVFFI